MELEISRSNEMPVFRWLFEIARLSVLLEIWDCWLSRICFLFISRVQSKPFYFRLRDTCACADGWIGFDCRVPVCEQEYYEQNQEIFVKGSDNKKELEQFEWFIDKNQIHLDLVTGYSNPSYNLALERYINRSHVEKMNVKTDGKRYLKNDGTF